MNIIETIRAEIERRRNEWLEKSRLIKKGRDVAMYAAGKSSAYAEFLSYLDTLPEQSEVGDEYFLQIGKCTHTLRVGSTSDIDRLIRQDKKQPVEGRLEMAARHIWESWNGGTMDDVRRDMAELGAVLKERKEVVPAQPVEGLEGEIDKYFRLWRQGASDEGCVNADSQFVSIYDCHRIARHFAEWGASHAVAPYYFKLRELKTGRVFLAEWSDIAGEWYERGNGRAYQSDEVEIIPRDRKTPTP